MILFLYFCIIETKESVCIGYNGFLFRMSTKVKAEGVFIVTFVYCLGIVAFLKYNKEAQYIILITVIQFAIGTYHH
jgi:uncharacterized membrane protein